MPRNVMLNNAEKYLAISIIIDRYQPQRRPIVIGYLCNGNPMLSDAMQCLHKDASSLQKISNAY